jgi:hypothetical protein
MLLQVLLFRPLKISQQLPNLQLTLAKLAIGTNPTIITFSGTLARAYCFSLFGSIETTMVTKVKIRLCPRLDEWLPFSLQPRLFL